MAAFGSLKSQPLCLVEIENTLALRESLVDEKKKLEILLALVSASFQ